MYNKQTLYETNACLYNKPQFTSIKQTVPTCTLYTLYNFNTTNVPRRRFSTRTPSRRTNRRLFRTAPPTGALPSWAFVPRRTPTFHRTLRRRILTGGRTSRTRHIPFTCTATLLFRLRFLPTRHLTKHNNNNHTRLTFKCPKTKTKRSRAGSTWEGLGDNMRDLLFNTCKRWWVLTLFSWNGA